MLELDEPERQVDAVYEPERRLHEGLEHRRKVRGFPADCEVPVEDRSRERRVDVLVREVARRGVGDPGREPGGSRDDRETCQHDRVGYPCESRERL